MNGNAVHKITSTNVVEVHSTLVEGVTKLYYFCNNALDKASMTDKYYLLETQQRVVSLSK